VHPTEDDALPVHHNGVPACQSCGGQLGFACAGGAVEWWRCVACGQFYTARRGCSHGAIARMQCAACGRPSVSFSVIVRRLGHEITVHFCSKKCLTQGLDDPPAATPAAHPPRRKER
jgi:hypothetical protein